MSPSLHERLARKPPGYRFSIGRILAIYAALMAALMLAALDQTIVATALPRIVSDLGGLTSYSWVFTSYMLASTVTVPLYGKLGDVHGRRPLLLASIAIFLVGSALCGIAQGVIGTSATSSGVVLTPFMLGAVVTSILSGQLVSRTGRYRPKGLSGKAFLARVGRIAARCRVLSRANSPAIGAPCVLASLALQPSRAGGSVSGQAPNTLVGPVVLGAGMLLLWRMGVATTNGEAARNMVIAGVGLGMMMQIFVLAVQNSVPVRAMGSATALSQFARSIGATLGVALMGVIVNQGLPRAARSGTLVHRLPPALRHELASALQPAFLAAACVCALALAVSIAGIREAPLRRGFEEPAGAGSGGSA